MGCIFAHNSGWKFADRQNDWCTKLCRSDVDQLFPFSLGKKQKQMQLSMCAVCAYNKGKKAICKWHVIHYTRLHNFVSVANGISSWQPPYHIYVKWCIQYLSLSRFLAFHHHSPSVNVSSAFAIYAICNYIASLRSRACLLQNEWK